MDNEKNLSMGDILVLYDADGHWQGSYQFLRVDVDNGCRLIVRDRVTGQVFSAPPGLLVRPVLGTDSEMQSGERAENHPTGSMLPTAVARAGQPGAGKVG